VDYSGAARREFDQKEEISHSVLGKEEKTEGKARQKARQSETRKGIKLSMNILALYAYTKVHTKA